MMTAEVTRNFWHAPEMVWRVIGRFDAFDWAAGIGPLLMEAGRPRDQVGAIRAFRYYGVPVRQRLTARCVETPSYAYECLGPFRGLRHCEASLAAAARADGGATVTWRAEFHILQSLTARPFRGIGARGTRPVPGGEPEQNSAFDLATNPYEYWAAFLRAEFGKSLERVETILDMSLSG